MLSHYLRMTWRVLARHKIYSFINMAGLGVGLAGCLLIFMFVRDELTFDRYHENYEQIYRLRVERYAAGGEEELTAAASAPMLPAVLKDHPQVQSGTRFHRITALVESDDTRIYESNFFWADADVFKVFTWPLQKGDPATALQEPGSIVLTASAATRYFGAADAMGKTLMVEKQPMTVTGVMKDVPRR